MTILKKKFSLGHKYIIFISFSIWDQVFCCLFLKKKKKKSFVVFAIVVKFPIVCQRLI